MHELRRSGGSVRRHGAPAERDTTIAVVSRAPIEKIERRKHKMGWTFPWYSSYGSRFNFDYGVSFDETVDDPNGDAALPASSSSLPRVAVRRELGTVRALARMQGPAAALDPRPACRHLRDRRRHRPPSAVSGRSEDPACPRKQEPVLAGFELTPTAPLGEMMLIAGLGLDGNGWWRSIPGFAKRFRVITFDYRGVGVLALHHCSVPPTSWPTTSLPCSTRQGSNTFSCTGSPSEEWLQRLALRHFNRVTALALRAAHAGGTRACRQGWQRLRGSGWGGSSRPWPLPGRPSLTSTGSAGATVKSPDSVRPTRRVTIRGLRYCLALSSSAGA
jgi:Bacterial protein of unknown function (DUF899)